MALPDLLKTDISGISPLIDAARAPKETPQSLVKIPAAPRFGEDDTGTMKAQIGAGQQRLDKSYAEQERLIGETGNLTTQLAQYAANLVSYKNEQEVFKANQQKELAKKDSEIITKMLDEIRSGPLYKQKQETNKQIAEYSAFVPTEVTAPMLGVLFATIGATGMLLGGNSKNTAKAALSAMNGMAEGFGKGREQYDKERKQAFDSNVKLLQSKLSAINDGLEDARKEAILNKQAAELKVRETLAANEAQFLQENTNRRGLESTIELVKGQLASLNKSLELQKTKTNQIESQLQRQSDNLYLKQLAIQSAQAMQQDRIAAQIAADERRARERQEEIRLTASLRQPPAPKTGVQDGQLVQLPDARTLPVANLTPGAPTVLSPAAAAKTGQGEKAPAGIEKDIKQNAIIAENMRSTISSAEDLAKKGKLKSFGFIEGRIPYDVVQQFTSPEELRFIAQMNSLTNQQLKLQSGATVTAAEFARQKGVLPLVTDKPETVIIKLKLWQDLIDTETKVLGRAYPETVKKYSGATPDRLAERMDQAGATPGGSAADERSQAQAAILKAQNNKGLSSEQKQKMIDQVRAVYKRDTGLDL
jgi:hypothetical protein